MLVQKIRPCNINMIPLDIDFGMHGGGAPQGTWSQNTHHIIIKEPVLRACIMPVVEYV